MLYWRTIGVGSGAGGCIVKRGPVRSAALPTAVNNSLSTGHNKRTTLRVATYNVHKCRGLDGRTNVRRIASVLKALRADVVALQEVIGPDVRGGGQDEELAMRLNMLPLLAPARNYRGHLYGNAVLSHLPVVANITCDLSIDNHEPRLCQRVDIVFEGRLVRLYNVHLGTSGAERARQARRLIRFITGAHVRGTKILLGDFNEWRKGPATELLTERLKSLDLLPFLRWRRTYPGLLPVFHLDHFYYAGSVEVVQVEIPRRWPVLIASDHMPLLVELSIPMKGKTTWGRGRTDE